MILGLSIVDITSNRSLSTEHGKPVLSFTYHWEHTRHGFCFSPLEELTNNLQRKVEYEAKACKIYKQTWSTGLGVFPGLKHIYQYKTINNVGQPDLDFEMIFSVNISEQINKEREKSRTVSSNGR
jgi:hypothetical protein